MSQDPFSLLIGTLEKAKAQMMDSVQVTGQAGQWERAQWMIQKAKDLDDMINGLGQNGLGQTTLRPSAPPITPKPRPQKLPHYYIENNRLVKVGPSRDGSTYEHRVIRDHFDLMIDKLAEIASKTKTFETPDLIAVCDIPKHEPLIILAVLEEQKLLINVRRGRWVFVNANTFRADAQNVWAALPRS